MYYVFGFLMVVFVILVITTIESTILLCYFHLCSEVSATGGIVAETRLQPTYSSLFFSFFLSFFSKNYHWWWRSFLTGGAAALYLFCYEILFYFRYVFFGAADGSTGYLFLPCSLLTLRFPNFVP